MQSEEIKRQKENIIKIQKMLGVPMSNYTEAEEAEFNAKVEELKRQLMEGVE